VKRRVVGGRIQCTCELEHGKVTANPCWEFTKQNGFIADPHVPEKVAIYMKENGLTVVYEDVPGILHGLEEQDRAKEYPNIQDLLAKVLLEQVDFDPNKPPKPTIEPKSEVWVLDDCEWDKPGDTGRKYRLYKKGRYAPQRVIWETQRIKMPIRIHYLRLPDLSVAEYVRERLEGSGKLPSLPAEYVVLR